MKRLKIAFSAMAVVVLIAVMWECVHDREPSYQGRTLTGWLQEYLAAADPTTMTPQEGERELKAEQAIRCMGSKVVPQLVSLAKARDSIFRRILISISDHQFLVQMNFRTDTEKRSMAGLGFDALGSEGKSAVPTLLEMLKERDPDVHLSAVDCLGGIGPEAEAAVPLLLPDLNSTNNGVAREATWSLGRIHMKPELVVPALVQQLKATNISVRFRGETIDAISRFGVQAKAAAPYLIPLLTDEDEYNRSAATNALKAIGAEGAAGLGPG